MGYTRLVEKIPVNKTKYLLVRIRERKIMSTGYKANFEVGKLEWYKTKDTISNSPLKVRINFNVSKNDNSLFLEVYESEDRRRDPDQFNYILKITKDTPVEEIFGWLSNLPEHIVVLVMRFIKQQTLVIESEYQRATTDLHNVNAWTREHDFAWPEKSQTAVEKRNKEIFANDNEIGENLPSFTSGKAYQHWLETGMGAADAAEEIYGVPDPRLIED